MSLASYNFPLLELIVDTLPPIDAIYLLNFKFDNLFLNKSSLHIIYIVYFIKYKPFNITDNVFYFVKHGPYYFYCHNKAREAHITSQKTHIKCVTKIKVLLVTDSIDGIHVYKTHKCLAANAKAYSSTTISPRDVRATTNTDSTLSM